MKSIKRDVRGCDGASLLISFRLTTHSSHNAFQFLGETLKNGGSVDGLQSLIATNSLEAITDTSISLFYPHSRFAALGGLPACMIEIFISRGSELITVYLLGCGCRNCPIIVKTNMRVLRSSFVSQALSIGHKISSCYLFLLT